MRKTRVQWELPNEPEEDKDMDAVKTGMLIRTLRREKGLTQLQLAQKLHVSDKTVSKWERGQGCPDISSLPALSGVLDADLEQLLSGELDVNETLGGNMKKLRFYICPACGNILTAAADAAVSCCGKRLPVAVPQKAAAERLTVENVEDDLFITSDHPMDKDHYIAFTALLTGDAVLLRRQYPEWDLQVRMPAFARHGRLLWYCTRHGLFYQDF